MGSQSLEDAVFAAAAGDIAGADHALARASSEGVAPVQLVRAMLTHLQRLSQAKAAVAAGSSVGDAAKAMRPPVFFKRVPQFSRALAIWPAADLAAVAGRLREIERSCKTTGVPATELAGNTFLGIAIRAGQLARR